MGTRDGIDTGREPSGRVLSGPPLPAWVRSRSGETLVELLDRAVARNPEGPAFVMPRGLRLECWKYADLRRETQLIEATLAAKGVAAGSRVITWAPNDPWLVAAFFAVWRRGAAVVPLDLRMAPDVAIRIGRSVEPVLTLAGPGVPAADAAALGAPVLQVGESLAAGCVVLDGAPSAGVPAPDTLAEILFTSGTTSDPKGVMLTHAQLVHTARTIAVAAGLRRERALALIPLSHMYGQIVPLLHGLMSGSRLTFLPALTPNALLTAMQRDRITAITAVPALMKLLMDAIDGEARRQGREGRLGLLRRIALHLPLPARRLLFRTVLERFGGELRTISCGGALLPADLQLAWESLGVAVVQGYGSTECASISAHTRTSRRPGTVGTPLAGMRVRIAADGEVLVQGPNVMLGYWNRPDETAEVLEGGWAHTGDAGEVDRNGELVIRGRTRDRIALPNGLKVYPEDVEAAILAAGPVRGAVVLEAAPGRLAAVLVPADAAADSELALAVDVANRSLAPQQRVRRWVRWPEGDLPRTHTLKVRRRDVQVWFETQERAGRRGGDDLPAVAASPAPAPSTDGRSEGVDEADAVLPALARIVSDAVGGREVEAAAGTRLDDLGLDSLGRVDLALRIERVLGPSLDDSDIAATEDLRGLARLVTAARREPPRPEPARWAHSRPARFTRHWLDVLVTGPLVSLVARPSVTGLDNLRRLDGPMLLCPNHTSHLDAPSVRRVLPVAIRDRTAIAAAADYFFAGGPLGPAVALATGAFPFGRAEHIRASLERVASYLNEGWNVIVFPEGTRSTSGRMGAVRPGIGLLATQLGVPVVPIGIRGASAILPKGARMPRRRAGGHVRVVFGAPLVFEPTCTPAEATRCIEGAIRALAEPPGVPAGGVPAGGGGVPRGRRRGGTRAGRKC